MLVCESTAPLTLATGGCRQSGRWVGPDGLVRCSLHQIQEFGHSSDLVRAEGYEPPETAPAIIPASLPGRHAALDELAAEFGIDLGDADTVAEKQDAINAAR
jgi:hypothetical protein